LSEQKLKKSSSFFSRLKYAFAVKDAEPLNQDDLEFLDKITNKIKRRRMNIPAGFFFHMLTPLNFISSQALVVLEPLLGPFFKEEDYKRVIKILSNREGLKIFVDKLEGINSKNE